MQKNQAQNVILLLLVRGEFRIMNIIILLSLFGAAILSVPLILNSFFELSTLFLALRQQQLFSSFLFSLYDRTSSDYSLIEVSLLLGFLVTSFASGVAIGRRMAAIKTNYVHLGVSNFEANGSIAGVLLLVSLVVAGLSFSFAFALSSIAVYALSLLLHAPYLTPTTGESFWIYFAFIFVISFVPLSVGRAQIRARNL